MFPSSFSDLVQEALRERDFFFKVAPHLSRPLPIILPIYDSFPSVLFYAPYYWIGCKAYDLVAGKHGNSFTCIQNIKSIEDV